VTTKDFLWIDLALYDADLASGRVISSRIARRRRQRVEQAVDFDSISLDDQHYLRRFGEAVGAWVLVNEPDLTGFLPIQTLDRLAALAPQFADGDPAEFASLFINQYLLLTDAKVRTSAQKGRVVFGVTAYGLHSVTTKPWIEFAQHPQHVHECRHCGRVFVPTRRTAEYCSSSCRVTALKKRQKQAAS
jgi:hypothetical protein